MSPNMPGRNNITPQNNTYTVLLGVAFAITLAAAIYVAVMCYAYYDTIISIPK